MIRLVTCIVNERDYKFYFLKIAHMLIMLIAINILYLFDGRYWIL